MNTLSWLRSLVAGFFDSEEDELTDTREDIERELDALKAVATLAVAQARRAELELREAVEASAPDTTMQARMTRLRDERARAADLVERYRTHQARAVNDLERLGEARRIEQLNDERERLRRFVADTAGAVDRETLVELEDEARAEAVRLDVLAALDAGRKPMTVAESAQEQEGVPQEAAKLLQQDDLEQLWPGV